MFLKYFAYFSILTLDLLMIERRIVEFHFQKLEILFYPKKKNALVLALFLFDSLVCPPDSLQPCTIVSQNKNLVRSIQDLHNLLSHLMR